MAQIPGPGSLRLINGETLAGALGRDLSRLERADQTRPEGYPRRPQGHRYRPSRIAHRDGVVPPRVCRRFSGHDAARVEALLNLSAPHAICGILSFDQTFMQVVDGLAPLFAGSQASRPTAR
jgi:hypothetical protein